MPRPRIHPTGTLLALLLAAPLVACGGGGNDAPAAEPVPFDSARALGFVRHLAEDIGPRPPGSEGSRAAAEFIAQEFADARLSVLTSRFQYEAEPNRAATVAIAGDAYDAITAAGTASGSVSGPAAGIGTGDEPLEAGSLAGRVAVVQRGGTGTFYEKYDAARRAGAIAVVILNNEPGLLTAELGGVRATIPVVTLEQWAAETVLAAAASGANVSVDVPEPRMVEGANVVARSRRAHACVYAITANYDTVPGSPGANHNAAGVAVMLELAHQMAAMDPEPAVCFIALDGGFARGAGALAYLQSLSEVSRPAAIIHLSGIGGPGSLVIDGDRLLQEDALALAKGFGIEARAGGGRALTPATEPFRAISIPLIEVSRSIPGPAGGDTLDQIQEGAIQPVGQLAGRLLIELSAKVEP